MKKTSLIFIILFSFSFSFTERPTGYQLDDPGTALWVSFINNVDALGANMYGNVGLDFSISEKLEMCFDLGREFGSDFSETSQSFQFRWWIGSDLSLNFARDFGENSNDSDFLGIKFLTGPLCFAKPSSVSIVKFSP